MALTPEVLIPRLGDTLVEQGLLSIDQLNQALEQQKKGRAAGKSQLIGQILVEMGFIAKPTLDQAVTNQILKLQTALKQSNQSLERRVLERTAELEAAYQKLSELTKLKANFVSNISHELRTPLTHVRGYVDILIAEDFGPFTEDQKQALNVIKRASDRLGRLIDDLILFSTAETSTIQIQFIDCDLRPLGENVIARNQATAQQKNINLWLNCTEESVRTQADPDRIQWVMNQLIDNALKYTHPNGEVYLTITGEDGNALVSVIDTGIGIDPAQIDEIFEPFHQLDGSTTRKQGGTGIGLTLAKKIIESHGAKMIVSSLPGKGSKFEFRLASHSKKE